MGLSLRLGQDLLKGGIVGERLEQGESAHPTVQDMVGEVSGSEAKTTGHKRSCSGRTQGCQVKTPDPFYDLWDPDEPSR